MKSGEIDKRMRGGGKSWCVYCVASSGPCCISDLQINLPPKEMKSSLLAARIFLPNRFLPANPRGPTSARLSQPNSWGQPMFPANCLTQFLTAIGNLASKLI